MDHLFQTDRDRITVAILALGGEGGGVLADWIIEVANRNGYIAQGTSVPGVAQRTGSTVYYVEMIRRGAGGANRPDPVLAMMPVPGDVDIVIASELMEAGRAILRGFVSKDRTTLIGSTHRVYAISEKAAMGDGVAASQRILDAAGQRSARFIGFDMAAAASSAGSVISSVMLGALAGSEALPFEREAFEQAIRQGGKAVETNLGGFGLGFSRAQTGDPVPESERESVEPSTAAGRALKDRIEDRLPEAAHATAITGVRRLMDYQDRAYAELYLSRLEDVAGLDTGEDDWSLTREAARRIALWMAYEDTIRVADLKIRASRSARVEAEVRLAPGQLLSVTDYMHPRLREVCETMPAALGSFVLGSPLLRKWLEPRFARGRHIGTTSVRWFFVLYFLASLRAIRRSTLRYREEQDRIEGWLALVRENASSHPDAALEIVRCQDLIKGYSDTFERGLANFEVVMTEARQLGGQSKAATRIRGLREAALSDDTGAALRQKVVGVAA